MNPPRFLTLSFFALLVCGWVNGDAECVQEHMSLLLKLKHGFRNPPASWEPTSDCCHWEGITCDPKSGHVIWLDLGGHNISGVIDWDALFGLTSLRALDISFTSFDEISFPQTGSEKLKELRTLALINAGFSGQIPIGISRLTRLELLALTSWGYGSDSMGYLELRNPNFSTLIRNLHNLRVLRLAGVDLHQDPEWGTTLLTSVPHLQELYLLSANLTGPLPGSLFSLPLLQILHLSGNQLSGELDVSLNASTSLREIDLSNNQLCGQIPPSFFYLPSLETLDLQSNNFSGAIKLFKNIEGSEDIPMSDRLIYLDLSSNMLHGPIPIPPPSVWSVDFSNNSFSSAIPPEFFFNLSRMSYFSAADNNLSGEIPPSVCKAASLQTLDLSNNLFTGPIPSCLLESDQLIVMNLRRNRLQGTIPRNITRSCSLSTLILSDNHLEGSLPRSLGCCSDLQVLDLGNNHIVDTFPFWLGEKVSFRVLSLRSNKFYGPLIPTKSQEANCTFPGLQIFDLSSNNFNGKLSPICFSGLRLMMNLTLSPLNIQRYVPPSFYEINIVVIKGQAVPLLNILYTVIDFSNNRFEGDIHPTIGGLRGLNVLSLSHNSLTGNIPCEIGNLKQLQSLDLSTNHLSGKIPQCLTSLTFLESLNLSKNNLSGGIPQGGQFSTFSNASFQENPGLCGVPLSKQCGKNAIPTPPAVISDHSSSLSCYVIGLALSIGIGYGVGIAIVIVLQNSPLKFFREREQIVATS